MSDAGLRVLVADDDALVRMIMAETLRDAGFDVVEASGGAEACRLVEDPDHVALIVTDLNMPDFDGVAVANWARMHHPAVPILFVSGRPDLMQSVADPYHYLAKPFSMGQLAQAVGALLNQP